MLILAHVSDVADVITTQATNVDVASAYVDLTLSTQVATPGRKNTAITTATTTTVVAAPASGDVRNIKYLSIRNKDAAVTNVVTVRSVDTTNSVTAEHKKISLGPGEELVYDDGLWFVYDNTGAVKGSSAVTTSPTTVRCLTADQSNSTTTPTEVTGLSLPVAAGTYTFKYSIRYQSSATGTGVKYSVNHTGTVAFFVYWNRWVDTSATASTAAADQDAVAAAGQVMGAMAGRAKSTSGLGTTISVDTANADMLLIVEGLMEVTVAGDLELWHGSETAAATTTKTGSSIVLTKTL